VVTRGIENQRTVEFQHYKRIRRSLTRAKPRLDALLLRLVLRSFIAFGEFRITNGCLSSFANRITNATPRKR